MAIIHTGKRDASAALRFAGCGYWEIIMDALVDPTGVAGNEGKPQQIGDLLIRYGGEISVYPAESIVFNEGDEGDYIYFVLDGVIEVVSATRHMMQVRSGEFFGEMAMIDGEPRSGTALCLTDCQLARLDFARFEILLNDQPTILRGLMVKLSRIVRSLNRMAITDALTGCMARGHLEKILTRELQRARRTRTQLALMFIDIDSFKPVNDLLGHAEGDRLLQWVASTLIAATRTTDFVGRYGGDEFCVVLPDTQASSCAPLIARILSVCRLPAITSLNDAMFRLGGRGAVSLSIGAVDSHHSEKPSANDLLKAADAALYDAKRSGKGRGVIMTPRKRLEVLPP